MANRYRPFVIESDESDWAELDIVGNLICRYIFNSVICWKHALLWARNLDTWRVLIPLKMDSHTKTYNVSFGPTGTLTLEAISHNSTYGDTISNI